MQYLLISVRILLQNLGETIMGGFFNWWKDRNWILKIILFVIPLIMGLLWVIGSFTKFDRLIMFMVGLIVGGVLINLFLYEPVRDLINWFISIF